MKKNRSTRVLLVVLSLVGLLWFLSSRQESSSSSHPLYVVGLSANETEAKLGKPLSSVEGDCVMQPNAYSRLVGTHWHYAFKEDDRLMSIDLCLYKDRVFSQRIEQKTNRSGVTTTLTADWVSSRLLKGAQAETPKAFGLDL